jgi:hypothetical protein
MDCGLGSINHYFSNFQELAGPLLCSHMVFQQFIIIYLNLNFNLIKDNTNIMDMKGHMLIYFCIFVLLGKGKE